MIQEKRRLACYLLQFGSFIEVEVLVLWPQAASRNERQQVSEYCARSDRAKTSRLLQSPKQKRLVWAKNGGSNICLAFTLESKFSKIHLSNSSLTPRPSTYIYCNSYFKYICILSSFLPVISSASFILFQMPFFSRRSPLLRLVSCSTWLASFQMQQSIASPYHEFPSGYNTLCDKKICQEVLRIVNEERSTNGVGELCLNENLQNAAQLHR